jgi:WXG100 family type VII secretion target
MRALRVDTDQMTGAVSNIQTAVERLGSAKEMLSGIYGRIESAATSHDGDANDKVEGFRNRWNDEFGILSDMLSKFKDTITSAARAYDSADQELATGITAPPSGPPAEV